MTRPIHETVLEPFLEESWAALENLESSVSLLDSAGNRHTLSPILSAVQTMKASCSFIGLSRLATLAASLERVLLALRSNPAADATEGPALVLRGLAAVRELLEGLEATGEEIAPDRSRLLAELQEFAGAAPVAFIAEDESPAPQPVECEAEPERLSPCEPARTDIEQPPEEQGQPPEAIDQAAPPCRCRVLVVARSVVRRHLFCAAAESCGCETVGVDRTMLATELLHNEGRFELVVADAHLPEVADGRFSKSTGAAIGQPGHVPVLAVGSIARRNKPIELSAESCDCCLPRFSAVGLASAVASLCPAVEPYEAAA